MFIWGSDAFPIKEKYMQILHLSLSTSSKSAAQSLCAWEKLVLRPFFERVSIYRE